MNKRTEPMHDAKAVSVAVTVAVSVSVAVAVAVENPKISPVYQFQWIRKPLPVLTEVISMVCVYNGKRSV